MTTGRRMITTIDWYDQAMAEIEQLRAELAAERGRYALADREWRQMLTTVDWYDREYEQLRAENRRLRAELAAERARCAKS